MERPPALLIRARSVISDPALQPGARGARKLLVTEVFQAKERVATETVWSPPREGEKCPVQVMSDTECSVPPT